MSRFAWCASPPQAELDAARDALTARKPRGLPGGEALGYFATTNALPVSLFVNPSAGRSTVAV